METTDTRTPSPAVYIETSLVSYLTARPSRDLLVAAHQQLTEDEGRPTLRKDLRPESHGTKLTIVGHDAKVHSRQADDKSSF